MKNNWQVEINQDGNLFIKAQESMGDYINLFGLNQIETGICIYAHELRAVRMLLKKLFPSNSVKSLAAIESLILEEFCSTRSVSIFKRFLEKEEIPFRSFNNAA